MLAMIFCDSRSVYLKSRFHLFFIYLFILIFVFRIILSRLDFFLSFVLIVPTVIAHCAMRQFFQLLLTIDLPFFSLCFNILG